MLVDDQTAGGRMLPVAAILDRTPMMLLTILIGGVMQATRLSSIFDAALHLTNKS